MKRLCEPISVGIAIGLFLKYVVLPAIAAAGAWAFNAYRDPGFGTATVRLENITEKRSDSYVVRDVHSKKTEKVSSTLKFDYAWSSDLPESHKPALEAATLKYLGAAIRKVTGQTVSLTSATTHESTVELDPKKSRTWQIAIYDRVATGKFVVDRTALKQGSVEMPFEMVLSKRIEAKPIKSSDSAKR